MTLFEKIQEDLKTAMKARDELKVSTLRGLKAAAMNQAIALKKQLLEEPEVMDVIQKLLKQRQESIEAFTKGNRPDLASKESKEAEILRTYLPAQMDEAELKAIIQAALKELGASGTPALGQVMKAVLPKVKGRAEGKRVNELVVQLLKASP
ncbi:MAG: GatB/YqeY domain-containing protein [Candidatus Omnitrophica bacterium]|nr:GatB/YqeY domain-containing protein [Candidatus Omnitrophota bacterium]